MGGACRRTAGLAAMAGLLLAACTGGRTDRAWPLLLLPLVLLVIHVTVVCEEHSLEVRFADAYRTYKTSVRRYL